jgi:hypothetical protein
MSCRIVTPRIRFLVLKLTAKRLRARQFADLCTIGSRILGLGYTPSLEHKWRSKGIFARQNLKTAEFAK